MKTYKVIYQGEKEMLTANEIYDNFSDIDFGNGENDYIVINGNVINSNHKFSKWIERNLGISEIQMYCFG